MWWQCIFVFCWRCSPLLLELSRCHCVISGIGDVNIRDNDDIDDDVGISDGKFAVEGGIDSPRQAIYRCLALGLSALVEMRLPFAVADVVFVVIVVGSVVVVRDRVALLRCPSQQPCIAVNCCGNVVVF